MNASARINRMYNEGKCDQLEKKEEEEEDEDEDEDEAEDEDEDERMTTTIEESESKRKARSPKKGNIIVAPSTVSSRSR